MSEIISIPTPNTQHRAEGAPFNKKSREAPIPLQQVIQRSADYASTFQQKSNSKASTEATRRQQSAPGGRQQRSINRRRRSYFHLK